MKEKIKEKVDFLEEEIAEEIASIEGALDRLKHTLQAKKYVKAMTHAGQIEAYAGMINENLWRIAILLLAEEENEGED